MYKFKWGVSTKDCKKINFGTVPHEIVTIETFFSKFSLCAVRKLDIFSERNVFRKHKICEKFLNARLQKSVHIEAWKIILKWFSNVTIFRTEQKSSNQILTSIYIANLNSSNCRSYSINNKFNENYSTAYKDKNCGVLERGIILSRCCQKSSFIESHDCFANIKHWNWATTN